MDLFSHRKQWVSVSSQLVLRVTHQEQTLKAPKIHLKRGKGTQGFSAEYTGKKMTWGHRMKTAFIKMMREASS